MSHTLLAADAATASAYTLTPGRSWSLVAIALGLGGVVLGGPALARSGRGGGAGRTRAIVALVAGLTATVIGAWVVAAARGGPVTGYGIVGGRFPWGEVLPLPIVNPIPSARRRVETEPA